MKIKFKRLHKDAIPFSYTRANDACMDMYALKDTFIRCGETKIVNTGIALELPTGYEGIVRGRSGLSSKGILLHQGTIDETYRGDIGIIITNTTYNDFTIHKGDRLAQFTIKPVYTITFIEVDKLSDTDRGDSGYGSSGI